MHLLAETWVFPGICVDELSRWEFFAVVPCAKTVIVGNILRFTAPSVTSTEVWVYAAGILKSMTDFLSILLWNLLRFWQSCVNEAALSFSMFVVVVVIITGALKTLCLDYVVFELRRWENFVGGQRETTFIIRTVQMLLLSEEKSKENGQKDLRCIFMQR